MPAGSFFERCTSERDKALHYSSISILENKFVSCPDQSERSPESVSKQISAAADSLSLHILLSVKEREGSGRVRRDLAFTGSLYVTTNNAKGQCASDCTVDGSVHRQDKDSSLHW
ncbi:hypothetical protein EYF80_003287 [Liparis tanakae]|uniref:Uncharacterized protein n=1 Tax=Liparis tanakae TaxID=230148 RepID=A0A4Z2J913_9TELE|nr:hypothetical protein EYF80_003287 [Liparis tanakae]